MISAFEQALQERRILWSVQTGDDMQTFELGQRIGQALQGGEVIALEGEMGAGKTCLASGIARGLGVAQPATSPTFVIMRTYPAAGSLTLYHIDFYRLAGDSDVDTIGLEDCFGPSSVILAEWPGRCPHAFDDVTVVIEIQVLAGDQRRITALAGRLPIPPELESV